MDERLERHVEQMLEQPEHTVHERLNAAGVLIEVLLQMLVEQGVVDPHEFHRRRTKYTADMDQVMAEAKKRYQEQDPVGYMFKSIGF